LKLQEKNIGKTLKDIGTRTPFKIELLIVQEIKARIDK
jgi:hypothetical protein